MLLNPSKPMNLADCQGTTVLLGATGAGKGRVPLLREAAAPKAEERFPGIGKLDRRVEPSELIADPLRPRSGCSSVSGAAKAPLPTGLACMAAVCNTVMCSMDWGAFLDFAKVKGDASRSKAPSPAQRPARVRQHVFFLTTMMPPGIYLRENVG
jgi:hypothetical protein